MTKVEAFAEINRIQDDYINELVELIDSPENKMMKTINFTSATGTGKTKMMSKLINRYPECFFIITTLSKGQLHIQVKKSLSKDCVNNNYIVYGSADYKINSKLEAKDIISKIPLNTRCIWLRDEGHIKTNRYEELLLNECYKVINFSATNTHNDIKCYFTQTMMLRTVNQKNGTVRDAINKLLKVKEAHKTVANYNPCAIFRCVKNDERIYKEIIELCKKNKLKYIDITDEPFIMAELCNDDNEYDVIINKMKIVEGIDIRRAHVLFMDNQPSNTATTIQMIGRCRRNALLYRDDIDIFDESNKELLKNTRECYVYYNVNGMKVSTDENGELQYAFCNHISCQELKPGIPINVVNGQLSNGLYVIELANETGIFDIKIDEETGFNMIEPITDFYKNETECINDNYLYCYSEKICAKDVEQYFPLNVPKYEYICYKDKYEKEEMNNYYRLDNFQTINNVNSIISKKIMLEFNNEFNKYTDDYIYKLIKDVSIDTVFDINVYFSIENMKKQIQEYIIEHKGVKGYVGFCRFIESLEEKNIVLNHFDYNITEICSETEIVLLKYYFIKRKENGLATISFEDLLKKIIFSRQEYLCCCFDKKYSVYDFFKDVSLEQTSFDDMAKYIEKYLDDRVEKNEYGYIRKKCILDEIGKFTEFYCNKYEKTIVNYSCIKLEENGVLDEELLNRIEDFKNAKYRSNLYCKERNVDNITFIILENDIQCIYSHFRGKDFTIEIYPPQTLNVKESDITKYFNEIEKFFVEMKDNNIFFADSKKAVESITTSIKKLKCELENNIINTVNYHLDSFFKSLTDEEEYLIERKTIKSIERISDYELKDLANKEPCYKIINDKESAVIGVDLMKQIKTYNDDIDWVESKTVSSKISSFNKFSSFISKKYNKELEQSRFQLFSGKNDFDLDTKFNSMIGYCVEYYSKYLVYGEDFLKEYIEKYRRKRWYFSANEECIIVYACMLKYKDDMIKCYGIGVSNIIKTASLEKLINNKYFVHLITYFGKRTAKFVKNELYPNVKPTNDIDPDLSIRHISGLVDYITTDTILDVKVRNNIDERCIKQVLAYHYLSTKRSDLHINRVIVYDAVSDKAVVIKISEDNLVDKNVFDC